MFKYVEFLSRKKTAWERISLIHFIRGFREALGLTCGDLVEKLPKTKAKYGNITTYLGRLSRKFHFNPYNDTFTFVDASNAFYLESVRGHWNAALVFV